MPYSETYYLSGSGDEYCNNYLFLDTGETFNGKPVWWNGMGGENQRYIYYASAYLWEGVNIPPEYWPAYLWVVENVPPDEYSGEPLYYATGLAPWPDEIGYNVGVGPPPAPIISGTGTATYRILWGHSEAERASWQNPLQHRLSVWGNAGGGWKDLFWGTSGTLDSVTVSYKTPAGDNSSYKIVLIWPCPPNEEKSVSATNGDTITTTISFTDRYFGFQLAGTHTLSLQLWRYNNGAWVKVAEDTGAITLFAPTLAMSEPTEYSYLGASFRASVEVDEWYAPNNIVVDLSILEKRGLIYEDACEVEGTPLTITLPQKGGTTNIRALGNLVDGQQYALLARLRNASSVDYYSVDYGGQLYLVGAAMAFFTYAGTYGIEIVSPRNGAEINSPGCDVTVRLTGAVVGEIIVYVDGSPTLFSHAVAEFTSYISFVAARYYMIQAQQVRDGRLLATSEPIWVRCIYDFGTGGGGGEPPAIPQTGEPYLDIREPLPQQTVGRNFTLTLAYSGFQNNYAQLAVHAGSYTLYTGEIHITGTGIHYQPVAFPPEAAEGNYYIVVELVQGGARAYDAVPIILSEEGAANEPPQVEIIAPAEGENLSGRYNIRVAATDDVGLREVILFVDGVRQYSLTRPNSGSEYLFGLDTTTWANGEHIIAVLAIDVDGQTAQSTVSVFFANTQADRTRIFFTKQMGYDSSGNPLNTESERWLDEPLRRGIVVCNFPAADELPSDPRLRYIVQIGYHCPGDTTDWSRYTLLQNEASFVILPTGQKSIRWALRAEPQRTDMAWELEAQRVVRLRWDEQRNLLWILTANPNEIWQLGQTLTRYVELDAFGYSAEPLDMCLMGGGKIIVAYETSLLAYDLDTGDEAQALQVPMPANITVTALASAGATADCFFFAGADAAGGAALYRYTFAAPRQIARVASPPDYAFTTIAVFNDTLFCGDNAGGVYRYQERLIPETTLWSAVQCLGYNGGILYAAREGEEGSELFRKIANWTEAARFGFSRVTGLAPLNGAMYVGGVGTGGAYLWAETEAGFAQTIYLENAIGIADMVTGRRGENEQLYVAVATEENAYIYRIEVSSATGYICGVQLPDLHFRIISAGG